MSTDTIDKGTEQDVQEQDPQAQTRQADRDKAQAEGDERATAAAREHVERQADGLRALLQANTALTERIAELTCGIHAATCEPPTSPIAGFAGRKATP